MNIITERSFSYFLLNRQVRARSYLKETGTHSDSILFFKKYLWSSYYTIYSELGVEVWWLTKKRYLPCWCEAYHLVGEERDIKHIITKKIQIHKLWNAPWRKSTGHYGREQGYLVKNSRARESILEEGSHTQRSKVWTGVGEEKWKVHSWQRE